MVEFPRTRVSSTSSHTSTKRRKQPPHTRQFLRWLTALAVTSLVTAMTSDVTASAVSHRRNCLVCGGCFRRLVEVCEDVLETRVRGNSTMRDALSRKNRSFLHAKWVGLTTS